MSIFEEQNKSLNSELESRKKQFGIRIKFLRESQNLSQNDLASLCNVEKTSISRIENGKMNVTLKTCLILSKALNVEIIDFFKN